MPIAAVNWATPPHFEHPGPAAAARTASIRVAREIIQFSTDHTPDIVMLARCYLRELALPETD